MNYRHLYHAGSFADVFKHLLLISLVQSLLRKDKPFCYVDTHAGIGSYDLQTEAAQKTQEFTDGVGKLWHLQQVLLPPLVADYLQIIKAFNDKQGSAQLRYYPGSPCLVRQLLRPDDRMILTELHPEDVSSLRQQFLRDKQVAIHHLNGYQALKAFLPPKISRGLILIDPPFERVDEFAQMEKYLPLIVTRWRAAICAIWYPIKNTAAVAHFCQDLKNNGIRPILRCEISLPHLDNGLKACGMLVIHPPWQWQQEVTTILAWLCQVLGDTAEYNIEWLVPE